jgi:hypothetical protein
MELTVRQAAEQREQAEERLIELGFVLADKDNIVRAGHAAGVPKRRIAALTGLARMTVDAIIARAGKTDGNQE